MRRIAALPAALAPQPTFLEILREIKPGLL
jgi:hypothetical protein